MCIPGTAIRPTAIFRTSKSTKATPPTPPVRLCRSSKGDLCRSISRSSRYRRQTGSRRSVSTCRNLLHIEEVQKITQAGKLVFHTVGDTGDERGKEMDFVARMMTDDYDASPDAAIPAFFYHLGDVVYFAGDIDKYGECFYETVRGISWPDRLYSGQSRLPAG